MTPDFPLDVIPAVDLKQGQVVRGVGGRRDEYRPIESVLVRDARPATLAAAMGRCGFERLYVADLDAIAGAEPAWACYAALREHGAELWIDAGAGDVDRAEKLAGFTQAAGSRSRVIIGLESLPSLERLDEIWRRLDPERLIFSLDLFDGLPNCGWRCQREGQAPIDFTPLAIMERAIAAGVQNAIVLDVARVGCSIIDGQLELLRTIRDRWPQLRLISGGGVRSREDLQSLADAGCDAALVASALHYGRLIEPIGQAAP